jgi:hypothetical protein
MSRSFGVPVNETTGALAAGLPLSNVYATTTDQQKVWTELSTTLWYRPIEAFKFGLQYSYNRTGWFQATGSQAGPGIVAQANPVNTKSVGEAHRVEFVAFMYF